MQSEQLKLIDWEGLTLAPIKADMIFLVDQLYFNECLKMYQEIHPNFLIDPEIMQFYQIRRKLEDIWEFIEQLLYDEQSKQESVVALSFLKEELKSLSK